MRKVLMLSMVVAITSQASQFLIDGKDATKGQAIIALAKNPKAQVVKVDIMMLDETKGTLKAVKSSK
jgi:hypothetical protein